MKKVFIVFALVLAGVFLASCKEDTSVADLQQAYDALGGVINTPSAITSNFNLPTDLINDVTAAWSSNQPGVISIGTPVDGIAIATVNRPAYGEDDATVVLTAILSIEGSDNTQTYTITITVIAAAAEELIIENIADVLAITDPAYDPSDPEDKTSVTLNNVTVFAKGDDSAFIYDGTGILQVYGGASTSMVVGSVYNVSGILEWYFGLWEITGSTAELQASATPQTPTQEEFTSVLDAIAGFNEDELNAPATGSVADGNMEPIYATVTGTVYMIPEDTSNYNTWIIDTEETDAAAAVAGTTDTPANAFMVYYHSNDFVTLKLFDGQEVTIDVVIHTYRSNNLAYALYYVGGPNGIVAANLTDEEKQSIDANALSVPELLSEATTLDLPTTGINGSSIVWESSNGALINASTGVVTMPAEGSSVVTLTATVSFTGLEDIEVEFDVVVGELEVTTMADFLTLDDGDVAYSEVEVLALYSSNRSAVVGDATGYGYIYNSSSMDVEVGDFIGLTYTVDVYNGLYEMTAVTIITPSGTDPNLTPTAVVWTATEAMALQSSSAWAPAYVTLEGLIGYASGDYTNAYWPDFYPDYVQTNGATTEVRDKVFTATGWVIGISSSKLTIAGEYTNATNLGDAEYVFLDALDITLSSQSFAEAGTLTLPTSGENGTAITWESDNEAIINTTTGAVTLPAEGSVNVVLTATVTKGSESYEREFTVSVTKPADYELSDLIITLYMEASTGNNKLIEIYNGTGAAIDLSAYRLVQGNNGKSFEDPENLITEPYILPLAGTLGNKEYVVAYNPETMTSIIDAYTANVNATILIPTPESGNPGASFAFFNGDDAILLQKTTDGGTTWVNVDIIGVYGVDPGANWSGGDISTANMVLVRKDTVVMGVTVNPATFDPSVEWTSTTVGEDISEICSYIPVPPAE